MDSYFEVPILLALDGQGVIKIFGRRRVNGEDALCTEVTSNI